MAEEKQVEKTQEQTATKTNAASPHPPIGFDDNDKQRKTRLNAIVITFTVAVLAVFFGIQLVNQTGVFHQAGELLFADSATELNRDFVTGNLSIDDLELKSDLTIGATSSTEILNNDNYLLYDILLPVGNFDDTTISVNSEQATQENLLSVWDLDNSHRLLELNGEYYLDNFTSGALFQYLTFEGDADDIKKVKNLLGEKIAAFPNQDTVLTLAQTGVTALSRRMNTKLNQVGNAGYFSEYIGDFLSSFDFTHTSNEASFSTSANGSNICALPGMIDTITSSGINIIELTGNHNQDCGDQAAIDTIALYDELGIQTFGGGITADAAAIPIEINDKDTSITLLGYNLSTGGYTLDNTPGANFYTTEKAQSDISAAKARGDFVIVDIQYYECNEYANTEDSTVCDYANSAAGDQIGLFRELIDMGANIVVGTAAHQPQTYEQYHGGEIYYGLGNLFFDQSAWPDTTRSLVLVHYFWEGKLLQTRLVPTVYDQNFQTRLMSATDASSFLNRLIQARPEQ